MTKARAVWTQMMGISEASAEVTGNRTGISHSLCLLSYHSVLQLMYNFSPHCHIGLVKLVLHAASEVLILSDGCYHRQPNLTIY